MTKAVTKWIVECAKQAQVSGLIVGVIGRFGGVLPETYEGIRC